MSGPLWPSRFCPTPDDPLSPRAVLVCSSDSKQNQKKNEEKKKKAKKKAAPMSVVQYPSALFFKHNKALGPPCRRAAVAPARAMPPQPGHAATTPREARAEFSRRRPAGC